MHNFPSLFFSTGKLRALSLCVFVCIASAFGTVQAAAGAGFDCFALVAFLTLYSSYLLSLSLVSFFGGFPLNFHCFVLFCFELHIEKRFFNFLKIQSKYVLHKQRVSREPRWKSEEGVGGERGGCMRDNVR